MPKIQTYNPQVQTAGPVQARVARDEDFGSAMFEQTAKVGAAFTGAGEVLQRRANQIDVTNAHSGLSSLGASEQLRLSDELKKLDRNAPDFEQKLQDFTKTFTDQYDENAAKVRDTISTNAGAAYFDKQNAALKAQVIKMAASGQQELAGVAFGEKYDSGLKANVAAVVGNPFMYDFNRQQQKNYLDELVSKGYIDQKTAIKLSDEAERQFAFARVDGWINSKHPEIAKEELLSGALDKQLGIDKESAIRSADQAINAKRIEDERLARAQDDALKMAQTKTQNDFLQKMVDNQLTTDDILKSNLEPFGSGSKETFFQLMKADIRSAGKIKTDPGVLFNLFERTVAPDSDPNKIKSDSDYNKYFLEGKLSKEDLQWLRAEFQGRHTQAGMVESDARKSVLDYAKKTLDSSDPLLGIRDVEGQAQLKKYKDWFWPEYNRLRQEGKSVQEITAADGPLWKGVDRFKRSQDQKLNSLAGSINGPSPTPSPTPTIPPEDMAKDGESIADWKKRTGRH